MRPGRRMAPAPQIVGWRCEYGHNLAMGAQPFDDTENDPA